MGLGHAALKQGCARCPRHDHVVAEKPNLVGQTYRLGFGATWLGVALGVNLGPFLVATKHDTAAAMRGEAGLDLAMKMVGLVELATSQSHLGHILQR